MEEGGEVGEFGVGGGGGEPGLSVGGLVSAWVRGGWGGKGMGERKGGVDFYLLVTLG